MTTANTPRPVVAKLNREVTRILGLPDVKERLLALEPPPALEVLDVDTDPALQQRYGLEVPVLQVRSGQGDRQLPRVPPRLAGASLQVWLQKHGFSSQDA